MPGLVEALQKRRQLVVGSSLVAVVLVVALAAGGHKAGTAQTSPQLATVTRASGCPTSDASKGREGGIRLAADQDGELVPTGATSLLVCRYNGANNLPPINLASKPAFTLIASAHLSGTGDQAKIDAIIAGLNAMPAKLSGVINCPADLGRDLLLYFGYRSTSRDYRYVVNIDGCQTITSGQVTRLGLDAAVIGTLKALVPVAGVS